MKIYYSYKYSWQDKLAYSKLSFDEDKKRISRR